jgi:hypothetical protein
MIGSMPRPARRARRARNPEHGTTRRRDADAACRFEVDVRRRLPACDLVAAHQRRETRQQSSTHQLRMRAITPGRRRHGSRDSAPVEPVDELEHSRLDREPVALDDFIVRSVPACRTASTDSRHSACSAEQS